MILKESMLKKVRLTTLEKSRNLNTYFTLILKVKLYYLLVCITEEKFFFDYSEMLLGERVKKKYETNLRLPLG